MATDCPSCFGSGWVTVWGGNIVFASGPCRCTGAPGWVWASNKEPARPSVEGEDEKS
jgi:hypothetical protein